MSTNQTGNNNLRNLLDLHIIIYSVLFGGLIAKKLQISWCIKKRHAVLPIYKVNTGKYDHIWSTYRRQLPELKVNIENSGYVVFPLIFIIHIKSFIFWYTFVMIVANLLTVLDWEYYITLFDATQNLQFFWNHCNQQVIINYALFWIIDECIKA